jgi:hypothetical protein
MILSDGLRKLEGVKDVERLGGLSTSVSKDGTDSAEIEGAEYESVSLSQSLER